jgi:radical SAM superfamily enzyme YgiQ (UPF0313 family)
LPLSLLYLSGAARNRCREIKIFDYNIKGNDDMALDTMITTVKPMLVGINCLFSGNFPEVWRIAAHIKQKFSSVKVVTGGMHPTLYAREIMNNCLCFDAVVMAEGDRSFPLLIDYYAGGNFNELGGGV